MWVRGVVFGVVAAVLLASCASAPGVAPTQTPAARPTLAAVAQETAVPAVRGTPTAEGGTTVPAQAPSIRGAITQLNKQASGDTLAIMMVEGQIESDTQFDKASVRITKNTVILEQEGGARRSAALDTLKTGDRVEVIFTGPVAESYPVQATAGQVVVLR